MLVIKFLLRSREVKIGSVQPYSVADLIVSGCSLLLVVLSLHIVSGLFEGIASLLVDLRHGCCEFCGCRVHEWRRSGRVRKNSWIASVKHHEGTFACRAVNLIVVGELSEWEPVAPVGLSVVNKDSELLLNLLVNLLCLSVGLRVECGGGIRCNVEHFVKLLHEL